MTPEPDWLPARIVLVGFMGAGKTTIGRLLATRLGRPFVDLDRLIETREGHSVPSLFAERGELGFREAERAAAASLATGALVLATGGGAWAQAETRALLQPGAFVIWLSASLPEIVDRLNRGGARPMAADRARIPGLLAEREASYRLADLSVDTTHKSPPDVVARIVRLLRERGEGGRR